MKKILPFLALSTLLATPALALQVDVGGISNGEAINPQFAFCKPDGKGKTTDGGNINPQVRWTQGPAGTKSYALIVVDPDVPATFDDANKDGKTLPADMPRQDFYHWVLLDIPTTINSIKQGQDSYSHKPEGKAPGKTTYGINAKNDYGSFMKGDFGGYDGPCPPWNDERIHHYHFKIFALDVETLGLDEKTTGKEAMAKIKDHTLDSGESIGTYSNRAH